MNEAVIQKASCCCLFDRLVRILRLTPYVSYVSSVFCTITLALKCLVNAFDCPRDPLSIEYVVYH